MNFCKVLFYFQFLLLAGLAQNRPSNEVPRMPSKVEVMLTPASAPATLAELVKSSRLIALGKLTKILQPRILGKEHANSVPVTDHVFQLTEVFQGQAEVDSEILVTQTGGKWNGSDFVATDIPQFELGVEVVLFLLPTTEREVNADQRQRFYINGLWSGAFLLKDDLVSVSRSASESLKRHSGLEKASFLVLLRDEIRRVQKN